MRLNPAVAAVPGARARFLREAQLTSKIRHPNIVDVADMGNDAGQTYIVMELLSGEDLAQRLARGPLSAISLATSTLGAPSPRQKTARASLQRGVTRMEGLITDLLALSRVGAEAQRGTADPSLVAASIHDEMRERLAAEGGALGIDVQAARVRCNEGLLRQVLWNLIDNAVKYRRPEAPPEVSVLGRPSDGLYELRVSDRGVGIPHEEAAQVFEPFFRARKPTPVPGTGLGLSIVKRIVEVTGGSVTLDSKVGEGSTFKVVLPLDVLHQEK